VVVVFDSNELFAFKAKLVMLQKQAVSLLVITQKIAGEKQIFHFII
jgi:hypothetical protein